MELRPALKRLTYLLFAISGFCALVYEILWTKYLSLTFGTTMVAVSLVAGTFMGGLALGSFLIGRYADREGNLLRTYAFLEFGIALSALLFPPALNLVEMVYVRFSLWCPSCGPLTHATHLLFAALLLLPPTICMGGTFPLMCRFFARKKSGGQIGRLYALNTLGATLGAFLAGYLLIPSLGLSATGFLAAGLNLAIAFGSWRLSEKFGVTEPHDVSRATRDELPLQAIRHRPILLAIGAIGFFSMAYEILWTRVLLLFLGNTTYAFALLLSAFLIGLALGGALYARLVHPQLDERKVFVLLCLAMGLTILITAPFYDQLAKVFQFAHEASGERWWHLSMLSSLIIFCIIGPATILSGALLPAAVAIINPGKTHTGEGVGLVVLHNTIGAVLGSIVAGIVLTPSLGLLGSFRLIATLNILVGLILFYQYRSSTRFGNRVPVMASLGIVIAVLPASWDVKLMNSGVYCYAPKFSEAGGIDRALSGEKVLAVFEGIETTVAVKENADRSVRYFTVNGKTDGGNGHDMATQVLVGMLPMLLHPAPQDVLVIGYGSGITVGGVKEFKNAHVNCAEISPEVVKASTFFDIENRMALKSPNVSLFIEDGRNLLLTQNDKYDVIVSEPSNPWQAGNANLFTDEFYKLAASRLKSDGIFCQWLGLYDITPDNLRIACSTLLRHFPNVLVFKAGADLIMVSSSRPVEIDYTIIAQHMRLPGVSASLASIDVDNISDLIARYYFATEMTLSSFADNAAINSDDHNILEYSAHNNLGGKMFGKMQMANTMALTQAMSSERVPLINLGATRSEVRAALLDLGKAYYRAGSKEKAAFFMKKAAEYAKSMNDSAENAPLGSASENS